MSRTSFRFRPRFRGLAFGSLGLGGGLIGLGGVLAIPAALVGGGIGMILGGLYLRSPAWRIAVHIDDDALEVTAGSERRFRLPWADVNEVVASPTTKTCFVDGGDPQQSLLVPGPGAPAPYDIEDKAELYDQIIAHVPREKIREVALLERA